MVAAAIFIIIGLTLLSGYWDKRWLSLLLFAMAWVAMILLFIHHITTDLGLNL